MPINGDFLLELKYKNDIVDTVSPYVNLKRKGSNMVGLCPFHNEKTPSFTVYTESGSYYCFGCGAGGDVITFIRQIENLDYLEAINLLANKAGISLPEDGYDGSLQKLKSVVLEINRETAKFYHNCLMSSLGKEPLKYLTDRGFNHGSIRYFGTGFAPNEWDLLLKHLKSKGFSEADMLDADVVAKGRNGGIYDRFRGRIIFPIINLRGSVIGFGGRAMPGNDKTAKYINTSDTCVFKKSMNMYALNFAKNSGSQSIILAEGYMDVIALYQAGFTNAVAALGTAFTESQARLLSRYTKEVIVTLDSDSAGKKATDRAIAILNSSGVSVKVLRIPNAKDPDEYIKKMGASRFEALLNGAVSDIDYKLYIAAEGIDTESDDGIILYLKKAVEVLAELDDIIAKDLYAGRISDKFGISKTAVLDEVEKSRKKNYKKNHKKIIKEAITPKIKRDDVNPDKRLNIRAANAEESVISILMLNPDFLDLVKEKVLPEQFITGFNKRVFKAVCEVLENGQAFDLTLVGNRFTPQEMGQIAALQKRVIGHDNAKIELYDCIRVILEEKVKFDAQKSEVMSTEEWAENIKKIAEKKQRGR